MDKKPVNKGGRPKGTKNKSKKNVGGRPTKMTKEVIAKLETAFMNALTDTEACLVAEIDPKTFYMYLRKNPTFARKRTILKKSPNIKAKTNMVKRINSGQDKDADKRRLERKGKDEFSLKTEVEQTNTNIEIIKVGRKQTEK